jgi:hypothetical protein
MKITTLQNNNGMITTFTLEGDCYNLWTIETWIYIKSTGQLIRCHKVTRFL